MLPPLFFASPRLVGFALGLVVLIMAIAAVRRIAMRGPAKLCMGLGAISVAIAVGQPIWNRPAVGSIAVMVDLSASTRGATFRDRSSLLLRIHQLLGNYPYQVIAFADRNQTLPTQATLPEIACDQTRFLPVAADAILLFSDGQFELPAFAPPTYPVIDPAIDHPLDAAVTDLKSVGPQLAATVRNNGPPRNLIWTAATPQNHEIPTGNSTQFAIPTGSSEVTAAIAPGDLWPENDSLALSPLPPIHREQWWIGANPPAQWKRFDPSNLPADSSDYLRPAVVVLNNISADAISSSQQQHLVQYVRDLGGALVIVGGDHAFANGNYQGTLLEDVSPLASSPPKPTMQWLLLIDASGSMAGDGAIPSPWQIEVNAITHLLPGLPSDDGLSIGSFAESLRWWSAGKSVTDTQHLQLPPANIGPSGPTNLTAALTQIASTTDGALPAQLLLMTDADTDPPDPVTLANALKNNRIHLNLLAIGHGRALSALHDIATVTGGSVIEQLDPGQWVSSAKLLLRSAMPDRYEHRQIEIAPPPRSIGEWNQTWMKSTAGELEKSADSPMAAQWQFGLGKVTAIAYPADPVHVQSAAEQIAVAPDDPRFTVTWNARGKLTVCVNAIDHDQFMNGHSIQLDLFDPQSARAQQIPLLQTAPGHYEITIAAPRTTQLITVRDRNITLKRFAIAGRYPPEFDTIGNDRANLQALADRTGGHVINPGPAQPIHFNWPPRQTELTSEFAIAGFAMIAGGLVWNRRLRH
jgi:hypothetical protein